MRVRFTRQAEGQYLEALRYLLDRDPAGAVTVWIAAVWHARRVPREPEPAGGEG
mgnify:CR=1